MSIYRDHCGVTDLTRHVNAPGWIDLIIQIWFSKLVQTKFDFENHSISWSSDYLAINARCPCPIWGGVNKVTLPISFTFLHCATVFPIVGYTRFLIKSSRYGSGRVKGIWSTSILHIFYTAKILGQSTVTVDV